MKNFKVLGLFLTLVIALLCNSSFAKSSNIGTKDFKLGNTRAEVEAILKKKYKAKSISNPSKSSIQISLKKVVAKLEFDYQKNLYKIDLQIDSDKDGANIKKKMLSKEFGDPMVTTETYNSHTKLFRFAQWSKRGGRYKIELYESKYCRTNAYRPCVIKVVYLDKNLEQEHKANKENKKIKKKIKEEEEKYDF